MELYKLGARINGQWLYIMYNSWETMMDDINGRFRDFEKISIGKVTKVGRVSRA